MNEIAERIAEIRRLEGFFADCASVSDELDLLADPGPQWAIYALIKGRDVVYVGVSQAAAIRSRSHRRTKDYDKVHVYAMHCGACALATERDLIKRYAPKYNVTHNPN